MQLLRLPSFLFPMKNDIRVLTDYIEFTDNFGGIMDIFYNTNPSKS